MSRQAQQLLRSLASFLLTFCLLSASLQSVAHFHSNKNLTQQAFCADHKASSHHCAECLLRAGFLSCATRALVHSLVAVDSVEAVSFHTQITQRPDYKFLIPEPGAPPRTTSTSIFA